MSMPPKLYSDAVKQADKGPVAPNEETLLI